MADVLLLAGVELLRVRIPVPVTVHMFAVMIVGGLATGILAKIPGKFFSAVTGLVAISTLVGTVAIGVDDFRGGDLFDRVTGSECVGWNEYVGVADGIQESFDSKMSIINGYNFTPNQARAMIDDLDDLVDRLDKAEPPDAASGLDANLRAILMESRRQLVSYANGGDFKVTELNRLLNKQDGLIDAANGACHN